MRHLTAIHLDEASIISYHETVKRERDAAITDLLHANHFVPQQGPEPPLSLMLSVEENRLVFNLQKEETGDTHRIDLNFDAIRQVIRDYYKICDSYYQALNGPNRARLQAIDMGRRGIHDEGAQQLKEKLKPLADVDDNTARRLFTLICVLAIPGSRHVLG